MIDLPTYPCRISGELDFSPANTIVIPFWIRNVMRHNRIPDGSAYDYDLMRSVLCIEDMLHFKRCTTILDSQSFIRNNYMSSSPLRRHLEPKGSALKTEYYALVEPRLYSEATMSSLRD